MNSKQVLNAFEAYAVPEVVARVHVMIDKEHAYWAFDPEFENQAYLCKENGQVSIALTFDDKGEITDSQFSDDLLSGSGVENER